MPRRPCLGVLPDGRLCGIPGEGSYCPAHDPEPGRRAAKNKAHGLDTAYWKRLRVQVLERDGYRCQLAFPGCLGVADTVHIAEYLGGDHLSARPEDSTSACRPCHGRLDGPRAARSRR